MRVSCFLYCRESHVTTHIQTLGIARIFNSRLGFRLLFDCGGAGVLSSSVHCLVPSVDGCGGCVVRLALARARLDHGPGVVAETDLAQRHRQYYPVFPDRLGGTICAVCRGGYSNGADAHCDLAAGALVTRA